jgi:hypothetical protein
MGDIRIIFYFGLLIFIWLFIFPVSLHLSKTDLESNSSNFLKYVNNLSRFFAKNGILITILIQITTLIIAYIVAAKVLTPIFSSYSDAAITNATIQGKNYARQALTSLIPLSVLFKMIQSLIISATFIYYKLIKRKRYIILFIISLLSIPSNTLIFLILLIIINVMIKKDKTLNPAFKLD